MTSPPLENQNSKIPNPDEDPDLPLLRSWTSVYLFVLAFFVLLVLALTLLTRAFS
jgi:hypothetical protein